MPRDHAQQPDPSPAFEVLRRYLDARAAFTQADVEAVRAAFRVPSPMSVPQLHGTRRPRRGN